MQGVSSPTTPGAASGSAPGVRGAQAKPRKFRHTFWWYIKWCFTVITLVIFFVTGVMVSVGYGLYQRLEEIVPDVRVIATRNKAEPTRVYASDGAQLAEFKGEQRDWIPLQQLIVQREWKGEKFTRPAHIIDATIAIEDARFYSHPGMDPKRIVKAAWVNYSSGDIEQGGSTITEQLAKNVYLTRARTYSRRLNTALLALQLEKKFSKDEILELYLNEIYYGNNVYGCEAAAMRYFNRPSRELNIQQAAFLAGLPQSPTRLDPFRNYDNAIERQRLVLKAMLRHEKINYTQYLEAVKDDHTKKQIEQNKQRYLAERRNIQKWRSPYFVAYVRQYLKSKYNWDDEFLSKAGLKIYTTIDPKIQGVADTIMDRRLRSLGGRDLQGALVCIDPWTGHVLAMYGGRDYYAEKGGQWNRAAQAKRQPGSTFKPYVYATALEAGYSPNSTVTDSKLVLKDYGNHEIKNYNGGHRGRISFIKAIGESNNVAATKVLMQVGVQNVIQKAHLMGIESPLKPYPTLALGASEVSVLEHTSAFGVFATRGLRAEATPIERVENDAGEILVSHSHPVHGARVMNENAANQMWQMLRYAVTSGTGRAAQISGVETIGKTGTTQSKKDVWFMGASRDLVTGIWIGYDRPRYLGYSSSGGDWAAPAWQQFMRRAVEIQRNRDPVQKLVEDARITAQQRQIALQNKQEIRARLCEQSGLLATSLCTNTRVETFSAAGAAPSRSCNIPSHQPQARERTLSDAVPNASGDTPARRDTESGDSATPPETGIDDYGDDEEEAVEEPARRDASARGTSASRASGASAELVSAPVREGDEVSGTICADSGQLARRSCPVTVQRFFIASRAPRYACSQH